MSLRNKLIATAAGLWMGFSGAAWAVVAVPPPLDLTITDASGLPGSIVTPTIGFDVGSLVFKSLDLTFSYKASALTFRPLDSTVLYDGSSHPLNSLPTYALHAQPVVNDVATVTLSSFDLTGIPTTGPFILTAAFGINSLAPAGPYSVSVTGFVAEVPVWEEQSFSGLVTVTAVPEPEAWLLMLGGLGLVAWKRRARLLT